MVNQDIVENAKSNGLRRDSSLELLKIIAIILIVINHTTQTVGMTESPFLGQLSSGIAINTATTDLSVWVLVFFRFFGAIGNDIFIICSAWFLLDSHNIKVEKIIRLLLDVWIISVFWLITIKMMASGIALGPKTLIKCLFPTIFNNNWFVTCYILLYSIHPALNLVIESLDHKQHFVSMTVMAVLYFLFGTISSSFFYCSHLLVFITIYFVVAYWKKYVSGNTFRHGCWFATIGLSGMVVQLITMELLGNHIDFFKDRMEFWAKNSNPFVLLVALGGFFVFKEIHFENRLVNRVSALSLYIYLIHENLLVREYIRPILWNEFYLTVPYIPVVIVTLAFSAFIATSALLMSCLYRLLTMKSINVLSGILTEYCEKIVEKWN